MGRKQDINEDDDEVEAVSEKSVKEVLPTTDSIKQEQQIQVITNEQLIHLKLDRILELLLKQ
jgi:hypothetical protein